jgi:hypothetical protein
MSPIVGRLSCQAVFGRSADHVSVVGKRHLDHTFFRIGGHAANHEIELAFAQRWQE